jgi:protein-S-isoprenylcysteine O-methyltransferase Ste14
LSYSLVAKRLRLPLGFVIAGLYLYLTPTPSTTPLTLAVGAGIALVGVLIRAWASGHIVKNDRLATTGPYAHTRNPLYFGSFLIGAGFAIAAHWSLLLLVVAFWALIYAPTMERERTNIRNRFPDAYAEYERNVPAFVPRPRPWQPSGGSQRAPFSLSLYMKHGEWKAALGYAAVVLWVAVRLLRRL